MNDDMLRLEQAMHPDGFVDFYTMLGVSSDTPSAQIQENINALYQEAQMNRDHRVPARRRDYQTLLEILPQARLILLDEARSKRYKAYCQAVEMELPRMPYEEFVTALVREKEVADVRSDILTIRDLSRLRLASPDETTGETPANPDAAAEVPLVAGVEESKEIAATAPTPPVPIMAEEPALETAAAIPVVTPQPTPPASPVSEGQRFSPPAIIGGILILVGLVVSLPTLAGIPMILAIVLSLFCAGICAYVFSLTGEVVEA